MIDKDSIVKMLKEKYPISELSVKEIERYGTTLKCFEILDKGVPIIRIEDGISGGWIVKQLEEYTRLEFLSDLYEVLSH